MHHSREGLTSMAETILVVGSQDTDEHLVVWDLLKADYQVRYALDSNAIKIVVIESPSAVVLTHESEEIKNLCFSIRRVAPALPILVIGRERNTDVRAKFFQGDADAYIVEPFEPAELIARIRSAVRRSSKNQMDDPEYRKSLAAEMANLKRLIKKLKQQS
jgi:DNA-binding response OmpR family regulator